jgi:amidase
MGDWAFKSAGELARAIRKKKVGARELLEYFIERKERFNPELNAIVVEDLDVARKRADAADKATKKGESWGPLHGVPMTVKESFDLAGHPTTWGMPLFRDNIAQKDAVAVRRLKDHGAIVFGKTNVPVMLADFQSYNEIYGTTGNPWDPGRTPGGSSGGAAAALASGMTGLEIGSDIGGSIRNPAHYCGVYGHKPTYGILPVRGHFLPGVNTPADLSVIGPLARSAEDLALSLDAVAGSDRLDAGWKIDLPRPKQKKLKDFRIAVWLEHERCPVDAEVADRLQEVADTLGKAGAKLDDKARPEIDFNKAHQTYLALLNSVMTSRMPEDQFAEMVKQAEAVAADDTSDRAAMARAAVHRHRDWLALNEQRTRMRLAWLDFFKDYDAVLMPICATAAFPHDHSEPPGERTMTVNNAEQDYFAQLFWAGVAIAAYLPATVMPTGPGKTSGLPLGAQLLGGAYSDYVTIELARQLGEETGGFVAPPGYE